MSIHPNTDDRGREVCWDNETGLAGRYRCRRCAGTGRFITGVQNGKPVGPGGPCFRCGGKGYHDSADRKRNAGYDRFGRRY